MTRSPSEMARSALAAPMDGENDAGAVTVRGYLVKLLQTLWREEEGFNGKRPFGNSGWQSDVHRALVNAGLVAGTYDADGCLSQIDERAANALVLAAIGELGRAQ